MAALDTGAAVNNVSQKKTLSARVPIIENTYKNT
jgi:hypothetical protein